MADIRDWDALRRRIEPEPIEEWREIMEPGTSGKGVRSSDLNAAIALAYCPQLSRRIAHHVWRQCFWSKEATPAGAAGEWTDSHTARLTVWLQGQEVPVKATQVDLAVQAIARRFEVDPVRDYLNGLEWDLEKRLDGWLVAYCGAEDTEINRVIGAKFLIGAAARPLDPGCQMDTVLALEGPQGAGKSTLVRVLGGDYAGQCSVSVGGRDSQQIINSNWFNELPEIAALKKAEIEHVKAFVSARSDQYVPKWGRYPVTIKRRGVLIATLNPDGVGWMRDTTGNRRFWPVKVGLIDTDVLARDRDQILAEAVWRYHEGESWHIIEQRHHALVAAQQDERQQGDDWATIIASWLDGLDGGHANGTEAPTLLPPKVGQFTCHEIAQRALGIYAKELDQSTQTRVGIAMASLGYMKRKVSRNGRRVNVFEIG